MSRWAWVNIALEIVKLYFTRTRADAANANTTPEERPKVVNFSERQRRKADELRHIKRDE